MATISCRLGLSWEHHVTILLPWTCPWPCRGQICPRHTGSGPSLSVLKVLAISPLPTDPSFPFTFLTVTSTAPFVSVQGNRESSKPFILFFGLRDTLFAQQKSAPSQKLCKHLMKSLPKVSPWMCSYNSVQSTIKCHNKNVDGRTVWFNLQQGRRNG